MCHPYPWAHEGLLNRKIPRRLAGEPISPTSSSFPADQINVSGKLDLTVNSKHILRDWIEFIDPFPRFSLAQTTCG